MVELPGSTQEFCQLMPPLSTVCPVPSLKRYAFLREDLEMFSREDEEIVLREDEEIFSCEDEKTFFV